jgi:hypothetical protein
MMRRGMLILGAVLAALAMASVAVAAVVVEPRLVPVRMAPAKGSPRTVFRLSFHSPDQTGQTGTIRRLDTLNATGPHRSGCVWSANMGVPAARAGQLVKLALNPSKFGLRRGRWCTGTFHGTITESMRMTCIPPDACPMIEIAPRTIARFTFRVTPS